MENIRPKSIVKNSFYSVCYKFINVLFPLLVTIYSSHVLLPEGIGKVALAQNIVTYFVTVAALGIPNYGTKRIGAIQFDTEERNRVFSELFITNAVSTSICVIAFFITYFAHPYLNGNPLFIVFSFLIILNIINVDWLYQGLEEYKYIAVRSILIKCACLAALPVFVRNRSDTTQYAVILCVATVGNYIFNVVHLHKHVKFVFHGLNIRRHLKQIFILLASVCATEIYTLLDSTMVGTICSETDLGYYTNAMKTARMSYVMITAACAVYLPRLSLYFIEKKRDLYNKLATQGMKLVLLLAIPVFLGIEILADRIIPVLFGAEFKPGVLTLRILAMLVIVFSVAYIGGHLILISSNMEKYTLYAALSGAVSNFILNMILIRAMGFNGAAIASVVAESLVTGILLVAARKTVRYSIDRRFFLTTILSAAIMAVVVMGLNKIIKSDLVALLLCIICGGAVYFTLQIILKNDIVRLALKNIRCKLLKKQT